MKVSNTYITKEDLEHYEEKTDELFNKLSEIEQKEILKKAQVMIDKYINWIGNSND